MRKSTLLFSLVYAVLIFIFSCKPTFLEGMIVYFYFQENSIWMAGISCSAIVGVSLLLFLVFVVGWLVVCHYSMRLTLLFKEQEHERANECLREQAGKLHKVTTARQELFCMLILLKRTNEELANTLGISLSSVSKICYRMRVKLGLPKGPDVDAEICHIMDGQV